MATLPGLFSLSNKLYNLGGYYLEVRLDAIHINSEEATLISLYFANKEDINPNISIFSTRDPLDLDTAHEIISMVKDWLNDL